MESNYRNREFEQFLKQNADQYRMFPSEKVWKGIDNALHTRRRWYGLGLALLLLLTGAGVTLVMMTTPVDKNNLANATEQTSPQKQKVEAGRVQKQICALYSYFDLIQLQASPHPQLLEALHP